MAKCAFLTVFLLVTLSTVFSNQNVVEKALKPMDFKEPKEDFPVRTMQMNNRHVGRKIKLEGTQVTCEDHEAPCDAEESCVWLELITGEECVCDSVYGVELSSYTCIPDDEERV